MEEEKNNKGFVLFRINGKTPRELFENKFYRKKYTTMYKKINETSICHICGARSEVIIQQYISFIRMTRNIWELCDMQDVSPIYL